MPAPAPYAHLSVLAVRSSVSTIFPKAADINLFDELRLWSNMGTEPVLIFEKVDGVETIHDAALYARFLAKSPLDPGFDPSYAPV